MKTTPFLLYLFIFGTLIVSCKKKEKDPVNDTSQEKVLKNISYGPDERNRMDVYLPAGTSSKVLMGQKVVAGETVLAECGRDETIEGFSQ